MKNFYVIGNPVNHSLSPGVFKYIFSKLNIKATYSSYQPKSYQDFENFLYRKTHDFSGLNITLPYKIMAFNLVDNHDEFSTTSKTINCIKNINNNLLGYNTDSYGFIHMLDKLNIDNLDVLILGNGGSARTIVHSLLKKNYKSIYIWGRNKDNVDMFIKNINSKNVNPYTNASLNTFIVINCLPLIIDENTIEIIIEDILPRHSELFIDLNYLETLFTKKLIEKKINVILGLDMFIFQALKSFDIWFDNHYQNKITYNELKKLLSK